MKAPMLIQAAVIALVVVWAALFAAWRFVPVTSRRVATALLDAFDRPSLPPAWHTWLGRLRPQSSAGGSCGDGCSTCGGCAAPKPPVVEAQPLVFRPRSRP